MAFSLQLCLEGQHSGVTSSLLTLRLVFCGAYLLRLPVEDLWGIGSQTRHSNFKPFLLRLRQSVVLWQGWGGIHYIAQVHILARTAQISKEKQQSIITLWHEGQSIWKISRTLKVSSSAVAKTTKRYDETGSQEDRQQERKRHRITSAAEDTFIRVTSLRNCSLNKCLTQFK